MQTLLEETELIPSWADPLALLAPGTDPGRRQLNALKALFARNCPARVPETDSYLIPKVLHRIWLGGPPPPEVVRFGETWRRHHPAWDFVLWDEARVRAAGFDSQDLVDRASCFGQKADVLRVEILARHGGVYVDGDLECFRPFDTLLKRYEFFASTALLVRPHLGWPAAWPSPVIVNNALIGARAGHPILTAYLERVRTRWQPAEAYRVKPGELPAIHVWAMGGREQASHLRELGHRTYLPFHDAVAEFAERAGPRDVVLPHLYFHPTLGGGRAALLAMPQFWRRIATRAHRLAQMHRYDRVWPESYANHVSKQTWLKRPASLSSQNSP